MSEPAQAAPETPALDALLAEAQLTLAPSPPPPQHQRGPPTSSDSSYRFRQKRKVSYDYGYDGAGGGDDQEDDDWAAAVMGYGPAEMDRDERDDHYKGPSRPAKRPKTNASVQRERDPSKPLGGDAEARAVQLRAHPLAQIVEPDRVFCSACEKWVKLGQYAYYLHHWTQHLSTVHAPDRQRKKPGPKPGWQNALKFTPTKPKPAAPAASTSASAPVTPSRPPGYRALVNGKVVELPLQPTSAESSARLRNYNPQSATGKRAPLRNEQQRLAELVEDPDVYAVEMFRVRCRRCMRWVPLGHRGPYYTGQWSKHLLKCQGTANGVLPPGEEDMVVKLEPGDDSANLSSANGDHAEPAGDGDWDTQSYRQLTASPAPAAPAPLPAPASMPSTSTARPLLTHAPLPTRAPLPSRSYQSFHGVLPHLLVDVRSIPRPILLDAGDQPSPSLTQSPAPQTDSAMSGDPPSLTDTPEPTPPIDAVPLSAADLKILNPPDVFNRAESSAREREEAFRDDPLVAEVEPRRVRCTMCDTWLKLGAESDYAPGHWLVHRKRCKERPNWLKARGVGTKPNNPIKGKAPKAYNPPAIYPVAPRQARPTNGTPALAGHIMVPIPNGLPRPVLLPGGPGVVHYLPNGMPVPKPVLLPTPPPPPPPPPPPQGTRTLRALPAQSYAPAPAKAEDEFVFQTPGARLNELERRAQFERDPDVREVHPDAVMCNICGKWIKLSNTYPYASGNWSGLKGHKITCRKRHGLDVQHLIAAGARAPAPPPPTGEGSSTPSAGEKVRASARITKKLLEEEESLRHDERVRRIVDGRAQCNACGKWLKIPNFRMHLANRCRKMPIERGANRPDYDSESEADEPVWQEEEELSELTDVDSASESDWWVRSPTPPPPRPLSPQPDYVARYAMYLNPQIAAMAAPGQFTRSALPANNARLSAAQFAPHEVSASNEDFDLDDVRMLNGPDGESSSPHLLARPRVHYAPSGDASTRLFLTQPPYQPCPHRRDEDADSKPVDYLREAGLLVPPPPPRAYV